MPIYEYQCGQCGHQLEEFQKVSDAPLTECPQCHHTTLQRLVSATSFQLKGTGWYATDFRDKGKKPAESAEKSKDSEKSSTAESKTENTNSSSSSSGTDGKAEK